LARGFGGTTADHIDATAVSSLDITGDISIAGWVYISTAVGFSTVLYKGHDNVQADRKNNYNIDFGSDGKTFRFLYIDGSNNFQGYASAANAISITTWHHIALKYTFGTGSSMQLYLDGSTLSGSWIAGTGNTATVTNTDKLYFGAFLKTGSTYQNPSNGSLADFGIWNTLLTAGEISALAKGVSPNLTRRSSSKFYMPFWGTSSTEADLSGNGANGAVTGTTVSAHAPVGRYTPRKRFLRQFFPHPGCTNIGFTDGIGVNTEFPESIRVNTEIQSNLNNQSQTNTVNTQQITKPVWVNPA